MRFLFPLLAVLSVHAHKATTPPAGAVIVRPNTTVPGEFPDLGSAINALPADNSSQTVFVFPGLYVGQVNVSRPGPVTIRGYTEHALNYAHNTVTLLHNASLATGAGSDDRTGTLRVLSANVSLYNLNIVNNFGVALTNGQAIALSAQADQMGVYACGLFSYQDTLYTNVGNHIFLKSYIEGAVDYIFGRHSIAYFQGNTLASRGSGCITASGRQLNDSGIYLFEDNKVIAAADAFSNVTDHVFLGRPWGNWARVIFKNTDIQAPMNNTIWSIWNVGNANTDFVDYVEYNSFGPGVENANRPNFSTVITKKEAAGYTLQSIIPNWADWVDSKYVH
ncbi:unnamed protein product [Mycena citricolor]|uniref:Pectinesterase n=1 Tax=Mycena citricolor TaxID=2018698 RepID=A0AAD2Q6V8_9AGAR|nr:unnamed protein product [Mycena citricolor]